VCPPCLDGPDLSHRHNGFGRPPWAGLEAPLSFPDGWGRIGPPPCGDSGEGGGGGGRAWNMQLCDSMYQPLSSALSSSRCAFAGWADLVLS
jgi:hypothetical protein